MRVAVMAFSGVIAGLIFFWLIRFLTKKNKVSNPRIGGLHSLALGLGVGFAVSIASGFLYLWFHSNSFNFSEFFPELGLRMLANISPAVIEEVGFRAGLVHMLTEFYGPFYGLLGGSVPFGVLHLVGGFFGNHIGFDQVVGTSAAGLLMSILYLRYGFWAAVSCHWAWNMLCPQWVQALGLPRQGGVQALESAWTTILVLLSVSVLIYSRAVLRKNN
jgi:membrane protease YdiL (CAAX protease family)